MKRATLTARQAKRIRWQTGASEQTARTIAGLLHGEGRR